MLEVYFNDINNQNDPNHGLHLKFLYDLLQERIKEPDTNISHNSMPSYEDHISFVHSEPYREHYVLSNLDVKTQLIGCFYITFNNEIGIHIAKRYQGRGYGSFVIETLLRQAPDEYLANINPNNAKSIKLFEKFGFKHIQNTYRLSLPHDEA